MKTIFKKSTKWQNSKFALITLLATFATATVALTSCSKSKGSNNNAGYTCDAYGNCYAPNGTPYSPYGYGYANMIQLSGGVSVESSTAWKQALEGLGACSNAGILNTCNWSSVVGAAPQIAVTINDYKFPSGTSSGQLSVGSAQVYPSSFAVNWHTIDKNTAYDTQVLAPFEIKNRFMRVKITASAITNSQVTVELFYGGVRIGSGILYRN